LCMTEDHLDDCFDDRLGDGSGDGFGIGVAVRGRNSFGRMAIVATHATMADAQLNTTMVRKELMCDHGGRSFD